MNATEENVTGPGETPTHPIVSWLRTLIIFAITLLIITSNLINLIVLRRTTEIPSNSRFCLMNLSSADFLLGCVSCAPCIVSTAVDRWLYGDVWCQIAAIMHGTTVTVSIWSLALISVDRYLAIIHPLRYHELMTLKRCRIVVACFWCVSLMTFVFPLTLNANFLYYRYSYAESLCGLYWGYPWFCIVTAIYIPVLSGSVLAVTNFWIIRAVIKMRRSSVVRILPEQSVMAAARDQESNADAPEDRNSNGLPARDPESLRQKQHDKSRFRDGDSTKVLPVDGRESQSEACTGSAKRNGNIKTQMSIENIGGESRDLKAVKVLAVTAVTYFTAWGPYVTSVMITSISPDIVLPVWLRFLVMWLANANSFMNVIIYSVMYSSFRKNAWRLIKDRFTCKVCSGSSRINPFAS